MVFDKYEEKWTKGFRHLLPSAPSLQKSQIAAPIVPTNQNLTTTVTLGGVQVDQGVLEILAGEGGGKEMEGLGAGEGGSGAGKVSVPSVEDSLMGY